MLIDSHCHLDLVSPDLSAVPGLLDAAQARGIGGFLCVATGRDNVATVASLAQSYSRVYATAGVHPNTEEAHEPTTDELIAWGRVPRVVAVGETGLDYYRSPPDKGQRERLRRHIRAARELAKPLIIHTRDAARDTIDTLREEGADQVGGIMHCFVEDWETARVALELGFYISFSGIVTFKSAEDLRAVARRVPDDRLLVETDSPYLAPVPHRGKTNQPAFVREVADFLAELRGTTRQEIERITSANFRRLFPTVDFAPLPDAVGG